MTVHGRILSFHAFSKGSWGLERTLSPEPQDVTLPGTTVVRNYQLFFWHLAEKTPVIFMLFHSKDVMLCSASVLISCGLKISTHKFQVRELVRDSCSHATDTPRPETRLHHVCQKRRERLVTERLSAGPCPQRRAASGPRGLARRPGARDVGAGPAGRGREYPGSQDVPRTERQCLVNPRSAGQVLSLFGTSSFHTTLGFQI